MQNAFATIECEVLHALRRLGLQEHTTRVLLRADERLTKLEQLAVFRWTTQPERPGAFARVDLERAKDFGSAIGHRVNELAPAFTRYAVELNFRRFTPPYSSWEWVIEVRWAIVPDPWESRFAQPKM